MKKFGMKKLVVLLVVFGLVLAGCGGPKGEEIVFWNPFAGADGETFQSMVDAFNEEYTGQYYINSQTTANDGNAYYDKIKTAAQSGDEPDLAIMHIDEMPTYASNNVIVPWSQEELATIGVTQDMYSEEIYNAAQYNGELYSIPIDEHPLVMWVNLDEVDESEIPSTWDELVAFANASKGEDVYNVCLPANPYITNRVVYSAFLQNDVPIVSEDGLTAQYNTEVAKEFLTKYQELSLSDATPEPGSDAGNMFTIGECATQFEGIWMKAAYEEAGVNATAVPISTMFGPIPANWASSHTFVKFDKEYTEEQIAGIEAFIKYIIENSYTWATTGQIPANQQALNSEEFKALEPQYSLSQSISEFKFYPNVPTKGAIWSPMERTANEVYLGTKTPEDALKEASDEGTAKAAEVA